MKNRVVTPNLLTQARQVAEQVGKILDRKVSLEQLESIYSILDENVGMASSQAPMTQVKATKIRKRVQRPLTTPEGRYSKNLKKVRPEPGDVIINATRKGKAYRYLGTPSVKEMLDGPMTLFLNFTDTNVIRKFKNSLRAIARLDGFGVKIRHLAYNRITVELGDIDHEYYAKRFKAEA